MRAALPETPEGHFPPGRFLGLFADPAIPKASFLRAPGAQAAGREGKGGGLSPGQEIKPGSGLAHC